MLTKPFVLVAAMTILVFLAITSSAIAMPPAIVISESSLSTGLTDSEIQQIQDRIDYWVKEIVASKSKKTVIESRQQLMTDYARHMSPHYSHEFASRAANALVMAIKNMPENAPLADTKRISLALAISKMRQPGIQPALDFLVANKMPAVRYLGWAGYKSIQRAILTKGGESAEAMLASLKAHCATEPNPLVAGMIYATLQIPSRTLEGADEKEYNLLQTTALEIIQDGLLKRCGRLASGQDALAGSLDKAAIALMKFAKPMKGVTSAEDSIMQAAATIAYAASKAYHRNKAREGILAAVLLRCEEVLASVSGKNLNPIVSVLKNRKLKPSEKGLDMQRAVLKWIAALKDRDVRTPKFPKPKPVKTKKNAGKDTGKNTSAKTAAKKAEPKPEK